MTKPSTDVIRRVFDEEGRNFLEVGPYADAPECVELRAIPGDCSEGYYGRVSIPISAAMAKELGTALLAAADEAGKRNA